MHVIIKDIEFSSPLLTASGTYGYGHEVQDMVDVNQWGGIITKSVTRYPREGNPPPRIAETSSGMLNSIGLANLGVENYCKEIIPFLNELQTKVIINIAGTALKDYLETLDILESAKGRHVGYEINISCPNVKEGGMEFGVNCEMTEKLTQEMRKMTDKKNLATVRIYINGKEMLYSHQNMVAAINSFLPYLTNDDLDEMMKTFSTLKEHRRQKEYLALLEAREKSIQKNRHDT